MEHLSGDVAKRCKELDKLAAGPTWGQLAKDDAKVRALYGECSRLNDGKLDAYNGLADRLSGAAQKGDSR